MPLRFSLLLALALGVAACDSAVPPPDTGMEGLVAPQGYDFATSQEVPVRITSVDAAGAPAADAPFTLLDDAGRTIVTGFTDLDGAFDLAVPLAARVRALTLRVDGQPDQTAPVAGGVALSFRAPTTAAAAAPKPSCPGGSGGGDVKALVFFPGQGETATMAFEDQWPGEGDYDFNDLVLSYNFCFGLGNKSRLRETEATITIEAVGGSLRNGFGFQLPIDIEKVKEVTRSVNGSAPVEIGVDAAASDASVTTILAFEDATALIGRTPGAYANTDPDAPYLPPPTITIFVESNSDETQGTLDLDVLNPFVYVDGERGREIHLAGAAPTAAADPTLFGTQDDTSAPGAGRTYVTRHNLPWAINLTDGFDHPIEKATLTDAYPRFAEWATSGGAQYPDWYTNPAYRIAAFVYSR